MSIHHNAEPDEARATPGAETYFQIAVAGVEACGRASCTRSWSRPSAPTTSSGSADRDAGAKYRPAADGTDYYGILRRSAGVPAVLSEAAFISNPAEEALLADPAFQRVEAKALTDAIVRFATTDDPAAASSPRTRGPSRPGPGGGSDGCEDPPLG